MSAPPRFLDEITDLYRRALQREALLVAMARACPLAGRRAKLQTLCELSVETRACLRPLLLRHGGLPADSDTWSDRGRRRAVSQSRRRWIDFAEALYADVSPGIARYERLERLAPADASPRLAHATALQVSMRSFAELELRGRGAESTRPARALLDGRSPVAVAAG